MSGRTLPTAAALLVAGDRHSRGSHATLSVKGGDCILHADRIQSRQFLSSACERKCGWFGWPTAEKLEALRQQWFDAPDLASQQALCVAGLSSALRRSELVAFGLEQVTWTRNGMMLMIDRPKTGRTAF